MRHVIAVSSVACLLILAAAGIGAQAADHGRYCLVQDHTGASNCTFRSLASCLKSKTGNTDTCVPNGNMGSGLRSERHRY